MKSYAVVEQGTGRIRGMLRGSSEQIEVNTPPAGCVLIEGEYDPNTQRIDPQTGQAVTFVPDPPDLAAAAVVAAQEKIDLLEYKQARVVRELVLGSVDIRLSRERLERIEAEIVACRAVLDALPP